MNRKTLFCFLTALIMIFVLAGCSGKNSGGNIDNVQIPDWKPSEIYSDSDIEAAFQTVKDYFGNEFDGCTLTKLSYPGDTYADDTVAKVDRQSFAISAIPHTVAVTVLADRKVGDLVNLETDIIGKYVEKLLSPAQESPAPASGITKEFLTRYGF